MITPQDTKENPRVLEAAAPDPDREEERLPKEAAFPVVAIVT